MYCINVRDMGAVGDGVTKDTAALQKAIDLCAADGGGTVYVPAGTYLTGKLILKDNITLDIAGGATLVTSPDMLTDYVKTPGYENSLYNTARKMGGDIPDTRKEGFSLLYACNARNIRITGQGTLDGNYKKLLIPREHIPGKIPAWRDYVSDLTVIYSPDRSGVYFPRPTVIFLEHCSHVIIEDVFIRDASMYTIQSRSGTDLTFRNITVDNYVGADNADGFHFSSCCDVRISDCILRCGDDCIAIDANDLTPSARFNVSNCIFNSRNNCFRIFTCLADHPLKRQLVSGGRVSDINILNCVVEDASAFVYINADEGTVERVNVTNASGRIDRLGTVFGITAHGARVDAVSFAHWNFVSNGAGYIYSNVPGAITNVKLTDIDIEVCPKTKVFGNGVDVPTHEEMGITQRGGLPAYWLSHYFPYFLQIKHADNLYMTDVHIRWGEAHIDDIDEINQSKETYAFPPTPVARYSSPNWPALEITGCKNVVARGLQCTPFGDAEAVVVADSEGISL
ncbi:MAG: right-handed parallel beta-helix repeat-containing protein [Clostridia bacterium]|nr:right-handed parallel beta-helix repeat-containing protein [Clostridia bacterium]